MGQNHCVADSRNGETRKIDETRTQKKKEASNNFCLVTMKHRFYYIHTMVIMRLHSFVLSA